MTLTPRASLEAPVVGDDRGQVAELAAHGDLQASLRFGRIVASEIEAPNMLGNLV
jgi:hypothetical protein